MAEAFLNTFERDYARVSATPDAARVLRQLNASFEHCNSVHRTRRWLPFAVQETVHRRDDRGR
jgi:hypothetical protein